MITQILGEVQAAHKPALRELLKAESSRTILHAGS